MYIRLTQFATSHKQRKDPGSIYVGTSCHNISASWDETFKINIRIVSVIAKRITHRQYGLMRNNECAGWNIWNNFEN